MAVVYSTQRKQIRDAIVTQLKTITQANGYSINVATVDPNIRNYDNVSEAADELPTANKSLPYVGLSSGVREAYEYFGSDVIHVEATVQFVAYISGEDFGADGTTYGDDEVDAFMDDLFVAFNDDQTWGGLAIQTFVDEMRTNQGQVFNSGKWIRMINGTLRIEYERTSKARA